MLPQVYEEETVKSTQEPLEDPQLLQACAEYLKDYRKLRERLIIQMIPVGGNEEMLSKVPHQRREDLAIVYRAMLRMDEQGEASMLLTDKNLEGYGVTPEQLHSDAEAVCEQNHPLTIRSMENVLFGTAEEDVKEPGLWVIGNDTGRYGAAVISYPGALEKIADRLGSGYYLIPSSIHEVLAISDRLQMRAKDIDSMVMGVNSSEVLPEEQLSDHCYHYDRETEQFESGLAYEARTDRQQRPV